MVLEHDPNRQSYEAWIESKAGACPPETLAKMAEVYVENTGFNHNEIQDRDWPFDPDVPVWPPEDEALEVPDE